MACGLLHTQCWLAARLQETSRTRSFWSHPMTPRCPLRAQTATAETPPTPTIAKATWRRTDLGFTHRNTRTTLCPDRVMDAFGPTFCQVSWTMTRHLCNNDQMFGTSIFFKLVSFCPVPQSTSTRRFRIWGQGFWNDQPHCHAKAPELTAACVMASAQATVWKTQDIWFPWVHGPRPLQPLTIRITWTIWPKLKLAPELPEWMI